MGWIDSIREKVGLGSKEEVSSTNNEPPFIDNFNRVNATEFIRDRLTKKNLELAEYTAAYAIMRGIQELWKVEAFKAAWNNPNELEHVTIRTINYFWVNAPKESCLAQSYNNMNGDLEKMRAEINWEVIKDIWNECKDKLSSN